MTWCYKRALTTQIHYGKGYLGTKRGYRSNTYKGQNQSHIEENAKEKIFFGWDDGGDTTACWDFLSRDYFETISHFWSLGVLPHKFTIGMMKVIPKKPDKSHLKDYRPLTKLTII